MKRTQLFLDEQMWGALHARARRDKTTVSELVRQAVREWYLGDFEQRKAAMQGFVGIRRGGGQAGSVEEVRTLRRGSRIDRVGGR